MNLEEAVRKIRAYQDSLKSREGRKLRFCVGCGQEFCIPKKTSFGQGRPPVHCSEWCKQIRLQSRYDEAIEAGTREAEVAQDIEMGRFEFFPYHPETERFCLEIEE